ncbi:serine/threonine-protein kinase [Pirellulaceae bacterium SH449]
MKPICNHITDQKLRILLLEHEESLESTQIAMHVETCEDCLMRLTELAKLSSLEPELSHLMAGYSSASPSPPASGSPSRTHDVEIDSSMDSDILDPPSHPEMLGRLGRYEIERKIGSGGMGVVFKATDTELNRPVAVKVLLPHLARNGAARQRFSRESRAAAAVVHEHVVAIHNVDSNAKLPYLVMQFVSGESLQARVDREGPLDADRILRIGIQAALGLAAAHEQGIVHRDIKPANILLEDGVDRLLITDFGLARTVDDASLTHTGVVAGTPNYMSPEQANGDAVDSRSDLFSLGSVLYFVATGHPPFRAERAMGVLHRICNQPHRPVWQINHAIPDSLSKSIDRLLEKDPAKRFSSATDVADALTRILKQMHNRSPSIMERMRSWQTRHQSASWAIAVLALLVVGISIFYPAIERYWQSGSLSELQEQVVVPEHSELPSQESGSVESLDNLFSIDETMQAQAGNRESTKSKETIDDLFGSSEPTPALNHTPSPSGAVMEWNREEVEFQAELNSISTKLNSLERSAPDIEPDAFETFRQEVSAIERALQSIDPVKNQN